jgi:hypothetical protein
MARAATTRMIPVPTLTVFQNTDSRIWVSVLSRTMARRRASLRRRKWEIIEVSAPATFTACTDPKVSARAPVIWAVAWRAASR